MHNFVIMFSFANNPSNGCSNKAIDYVESFQYSTKLFDNAYQLSTFKNLQELYDNINKNTDPHDKVIIIPFEVIIGKNIPNI